MGQKVIPCAITGEYVSGDGVTLGAAGSHNSVAIEYDFRAAGPQWDGTSKYVLWTNPLGTSTNRVDLGVDKKVPGYEDVYQAAPTEDAMCAPGWCKMTVVGVIVDTSTEPSTEVLKVTTEASRFRVLPVGSMTAENEGIAAAVADQLQTEIETVDSLKVSKPVAPDDPDGPEGYFLRSLGGGKTQWVEFDEGLVETVLENHPEWTTTVQDGSLTEPKFSDGLRLKTIKDYVTPEMFGAVGDGVTDDTFPFEQAISSGKNIILSKIYAVSSLVFDSIQNIGVIGINNSTIIISGTISIAGSRRLNIANINIDVIGNTRQNLINITNSDRLYFENIVISDAAERLTDYCVLVDGTTAAYYCVFDRCVFNSMKYALKLKRASNACTIINCQFYANDYCLLIDSSDGNRVIANTFQSFRVTAVKLEYNNYGSTTTGNIFCGNYFEGVSNEFLYADIDFSSSSHTSYNTFIGNKYSYPSGIIKFANMVSANMIYDMDGATYNNYIKLVGFVRIESISDTFKSVSQPNGLAFFRDGNDDTEFYINNSVSGVYKWHKVVHFNEDGKSVRLDTATIDKVLQYSKGYIVLGNDATVTTNKAMTWDSTNKLLKQYSTDLGTWVFYQPIRSYNQRPASMNIPGIMIFDNTLEKPIWWTGSKWVDAMGTEVT